MTGHHEGSPGRGWVRARKWPIDIVAGAFLVLGVGWVLLDRFVLSAWRGQSAYLPDVVVELALVAGVAWLLHVVRSRAADDTALLVASEARSRRITEAISTYIYTVRGREGGAAVAEYGPGCEAVTGFTADELAFDPYSWLSLVVPDDLDAAFEQARIALAGGQPGPIEHRILRKDGALRWVRSVIVPGVNASGTPVAYDGLVRTSPSAGLSRNSSARLTRWRRSASSRGHRHDFNNLLTAVRGYAELARGVLAGRSGPR